MTDKKYNVIFAEQFYYPDGWGGAQIPRDITIHLAKLGWRVEVLCGADPYAPMTGKPVEDPVKEGICIRRVPRLFSGDIHRLKLLRQVWYYAFGLPMLFVRRHAIIVTQTNPPLMVPIAALVALMHRRPLVIVAQDVYPEVMLAHGMIAGRGVAARILKRLFGWAYGRARKVVSLGPTMSQRLIEKGVRKDAIVEISNWATGEEGLVRGSHNRLRAEWELVDKLVLLYSGNLGIAHDIETPLRALAQALAYIPNLTLVFVGNGSRLNEARKLVGELGIEHAVQFRQFVPADLLPHSLGLADVALVTLKRGFEGLVVPSKLLGYLARGVPTIYVGPPSDISFYLDDSGGGLSFANDSSSEMAQAMRHLLASPERLRSMGQSGQQYYSDRLAREIGLEKYSALLSETLAERASVR